MSVKIYTPTCLKCGAKSIVELTDTEHSAVKANLLIQHALPNRDDSFRELVKSGTHAACWDEMFGGSQFSDDGEE